MFAVDAKSDSRNQAVTMKIWDTPSWSIKEYLDLLVSIGDLPPEEQQARLDAFAATHPDARLRTLLSEENYPDAPDASRNVFSVNDQAGNERMRLGVDAEDAPRLQFFDADGTATHEYPPFSLSATAPFGSRRRRFRPPRGTTANLSRSLAAARLRARESNAARTG